MMKTGYLKQNKRWSRARDSRWLLVTALLALALGPALVWFRGSATLLARPLWWTHDRVTATMERVGFFFTDRGDLSREVETLRERVSELEQRLIDRDLLAASNRYLQSVFGWAGETPTLVVARILAGPQQTPEEILIIDRGKNNITTPFQTGDLVTVNGTIALGRVKEVGGRVSQVGLFSAPGLETAVRIGSSQIPAVAMGRGGGNFLITLPRGVSVSEGALVTFTANDRDLVLGEVAGIDRDSNLTLQSLFVRFPVNLLQLNYVEINLTGR